MLYIITKTQDSFKMASESQEEVYSCPIVDCPFFAATAALWLTHLRNTRHSLKDIPCCDRECEAGPFNSFAALKSHFYRKHYYQTGDKTTDTNVCDSNGSTTHTLVSDDQLDQSFFFPDEMTEADISCMLGLNEDKQKRESALFLMRMKEVRKLFQTTIDEIVTNCQSLFDNTAKRLHTGVRQKLAKAGNDSIVVDEVFEKMKNPFLGLETKFLQEKYMVKEFQVLVSITTIKILFNYYMLL